MENDFLENFVKNFLGQPFLFFSSLSGTIK